MSFTFYLKYKKIISNIIIFIFIFYLLTQSNTLILSITKSTGIFITKLIPALFPYILITEFLINSGKINDLSLGASNILSKLFHVPKNSTSCVVIGFLLGYPNSAKYIAHLYSQKQIDTTTATKLVSFTSNANLSFIISAVGISIFNSVEIGIILAISHFLSAIIIGIIYIPSYTNNIIQQTHSNSNSFKKIYSSFDLLYISIYGALKTLAYIFAYMVIFALIPELIFNNVKLSKIAHAIFVGIFEISNGINTVANLNISFNLKLLLTSFTLSFSSLMILVQIFSFAHKAKVKFKDLIKFKILQGIISCIITCVITQFIYIPARPIYSNIDTFKLSLYLPYIKLYLLTLLYAILFILNCFRKKRQD